MDDTPERGSVLLSQLHSVVEHWIAIAPDSGIENSPERRLDVLQRLVELGRLKTGHVTNEVGIGDLLGVGIQLDQETNQLRVGGKRPGQEDRQTRWIWMAPSPRTPDELQVPLLLYLLQNHRRGARIGDLISDFVQGQQPSLTPFDMESTQTGVARVATNTRFAARALREWGLLMRSDQYIYKTWELTHLGLLVASALFLDHAQSMPPNRALVRRDEGGLTQAIQERCNVLATEEGLIRLLDRICRPHEDVFETLGCLRAVLTQFQIQISPAQGQRASQKTRQERARALLEQIKESIPLKRFADDLAAGVALDELLGIRKPESGTE